MHLSRKLFHSLGVLVVAVYAGFDLERALAATLLWCVVAVLLVLDLVRARLPAIQSRFEHLFRGILDPKDMRGLNGSTLYMMGCAGAVTLFASPNACGGILALALGDASAAIVGSSVRSPRLGKVSLAGSSACFAAATLGCALFVPWPAALAGGAVATLLEACSGSKLDNLTIPIGTAAVLWVL